MSDAVLAKCNAVVFDLDDTLYDSRMFWYGAFDDIAFEAEKEMKIKRKKIFKLLKSELDVKTSSYPRLFNDVATKLGIKDKAEQEKWAKQAVNIFHKHTPKLVPFRGVKKMLRWLKQRKKIGLLSNGRSVTQWKKIKALGMANIFDQVVLVQGSESKPSPVGYQKIAYRLQIKTGEMIYVGDNPEVDFSVCKRLGIKSIRVLTGPFGTRKLKKKNEVDYEINAVSDLFKLSILINEI